MKHLTILMAVLNQSCYDSLDIMQQQDWASTPVQLNFLDLISWPLNFPFNISENITFKRQNH